MYFAGRNGRGTARHVTGKSKYQITYVPKKQRPLSNGDNQGLDVDGYSLGFESNLWYPTCRPLKQWRARGTTSSSSVTDGCCLDSQVLVGPALKMLGKNENGENKQLGKCCDNGNVINFNGSSNIRSACTIVSKSYYQSSSQYLRARGNSYDFKSVVHKIPNVEYVKNGNVVWPNQIQHVPAFSVPVNSSYYYGNSQSKNCNLAVYKPSNSAFSVQGAVDSSSRIQRIKYNTITQNNQSFYQNSKQGINLRYQNNPIFFSKNKFSRPQVFSRGAKTICGSDCVSKSGFNAVSALG